MADPFTLHDLNLLQSVVWCLIPRKWGNKTLLTDYKILGVWKHVHANTMGCCQLFVLCCRHHMNDSCFYREVIQHLTKSRHSTTSFRIPQYNEIISVLLWMIYCPPLLIINEQKKYLTARMVLHMNTSTVRTPTAAVATTGFQGRPWNVGPGCHSSGKAAIS